jgi:tetratricopeptide (TPR) repeat protein
MDAPIATVIAACIGATASIVGTVITILAKSNSTQPTATPQKEATAAVQIPPRSETPVLGFRLRLFATILKAAVLLLVIVVGFFLILTIVIATGGSDKIDGDWRATLFFAFIFAWTAQYVGLRRKKSSFGQPEFQTETLREKGDEAECALQLGQEEPVDLLYVDAAVLHGFDGVARRMFDRALALDPNNIEAMPWMALTDLINGTSYFTDDRAPHLAAVEAMSVRAVSLAPNHAYAHLALGATLIVSNRATEGIAECERVLALDHNLAEAHAQIGSAKLFLGRGAETEAHMNEALRLSPRDIFAFRWLMTGGFAKLQVNADTEAIGWFLRSIETNRNFPLTHFGLAATLASLGSQDQARAAVKAGLALDPSFTIRRYREGAVSHNPTFLAKRERVYQGMRMAGCLRVTEASEKIRCNAH